MDLSIEYMESKAEGYFNNSLNINDIKPDSSNLNELALNIIWKRVIADYFGNGNLEIYDNSLVFSDSRLESLCQRIAAYAEVNYFERLR